jgi:hypothetical protein
MLYNKGIKKLDFAKYKRFFAFGCSFTNYKWPTWADILAQEIPEYYNYGVSGAGNFYIFHTVLQADALYNFTPDDLILIKWTNVHREDRYIEDSKHPKKGDTWLNRWLTPGNIYSQGIYTEDFMKYYSDTHCIMRDLSLLSCLKGYLENKNLAFDFLSMVPLASALDGAKLETTQTAKNAINAYRPLLESMPPSIYELIFNNNWHSISPRANYWVPWNPDYTDNHAHPAEHLEYIQKLYPETEFKNETVEYAKKWHQFVIEKHSAYDRPCIDRPLVKGFHSWREDLTYENNTM